MENPEIAQAFDEVADLLGRVDNTWGTLGG
jgi:hypothetical protein